MLVPWFFRTTKTDVEVINNSAFERSVCDIGTVLDIWCFETSWTHTIHTFHLMSLHCMHQTAYSCQCIKKFACPFFHLFMEIQLKNFITRTLAAWPIATSMVSKPLNRKHKWEIVIGHWIGSSEQKQKIIRANKRKKNGKIQRSSKNSQQEKYSFKYDLSNAFILNVCLRIGYS